MNAGTAATTPKKKNEPEVKDQPKTTHHQLNIQTQAAASTSSGGGKKSFGPIGSPKRSSTPLSKAEGIAAGEAILGMISQQRTGDAHHQQPSSSLNRGQQTSSSANVHTSRLLVPQQTISTKKQHGSSEPNVSREQLKTVLLELIDDDSFFDQIYTAYAARHSQSKA